MIDFIRTQRGGTVALGIILILYAIAFLGPLFAGSPTAVNIDDRLLAPSKEYLMGTDNFGRDILNRVIYGARTSLFITTLAALLGSLIGGFLGLLAGYRGKLLDIVTERIMEVLLLFPGLILALLIVAFLGRSTINIVIAVSIIFLPRVAGVMRAAALSIKEADYVQAGVALGASQWRMLFRHIAPNCLAPFLTMASVNLGLGIILESTISFIGLGVPPPTPSWGRDISDAMTFLVQAPWLSIFPGIFISITVLAFFILGDAIQDFTDPKRKIV